MLKLLSITALLSLSSVEAKSKEKRNFWSWKKNPIVSRVSWQGFMRASKPGIFAIGPTAYWMQRTVATGALQSGALEGFQLSHDRIQRGKFYWGANLGWAAGIIKGRTASGSPSKSKTQDFHVEVRFGHTFWPALKDSFYFTPFAAFGNFRNINKSVPPTTVRMTNTYQFPYLGFGLITSRFFMPSLSVGVTFETMLMFDGKNVQEGNGLARRKILMAPKAQFLLEMPFIYQISKRERGLAVQWTPFYNFRYYGGRWSEDRYFYATRFQVAGLKLYVTYRF